MVFRTLAVISGLLMTTTSIAGDTIPYSQAQKAGVKNCLPAIKAVSEHIIQDRNNGAFSRWFNNVDQKPFVSVIESEFFGKKTELSYILVAPLAPGNCAYTYTRTMYHEETCINVSKNIFANFQYQGEVNKNVARLSAPNAGGDAYLMPAGTGCVSIRQEIHEEFK